MTIRRAKQHDTAALLRLLSQVLELHAALRPDIFRSGTTKYDAEVLAALLENEQTPIFVAVDADGAVLGYVFCAVWTPQGANLHPTLTLHIDDLCVDVRCRGQGVGRALFDCALAEGRRRGCRAVTLNVWAGNDAAQRFYEHMGMTPRATLLELPLARVDSGQCTVDSCGNLNSFFIS